MFAHTHSFYMYVCKHVCLYVIESCDSSNRAYIGHAHEMGNTLIKRTRRNNKIISTCRDTYTV